MLVIASKLVDYLNDGSTVDDYPLEHLELANLEVEALIRSYDGNLPEDVDDWPDRAVVVALRVMARGFSGPDVAGLSSHSVSAGAFSQSFGFSESASAGSFYLTKQDKAILSGGSKGGAYVIDLIPKETRDYGPPGYGASEWLWRGSTY